MNVIEVVARLFREDAGQDLVEYGLLIATVAIGSVLVLQNLPGKMGTAFGNWGTNVLNLWVPSAPAP
jgi:Flp pilus assembly pilin Flp